MHERSLFCGFQHANTLPHRKWLCTESSMEETNLSKFLFNYQSFYETQRIYKNKEIFSNDHVSIICITNKDISISFCLSLTFGVGRYGLQLTLNQTNEITFEINQCQQTTRTIDCCMERIHISRYISGFYWPF